MGNFLEEVFWKPFQIPSRNNLGPDLAPQRDFEKARESTKTSRFVLANDPKYPIVLDSCAVTVFLPILLIKTWDSEPQTPLDPRPKWDEFQ